MTTNQEKWSKVAEAGRAALDSLREMRERAGTAPGSYASYRENIDTLIEGDLMACGLEELIEEAETRANDVELEVR